MFTLLQLAIGLVSAVCAALLSVYLFCRYYTPLQKKGKKKSNKTRSGRDLDIGNQAGRDIKIKTSVSEPCKRELFYFAQCKDLQSSVDRLLGIIDEKNKQQERYYAQFVRQEKIIQDQSLEIDGLRNELNTMKFEQLANRFPLLELKTKAGDDESKVA